MSTEPDLRLDEVAKALRVNPETVRRWLVAGRLRGYRPGGKRAGWRIPAEELRRFKAAAAHSAEEHEERSDG